MSAADLLLAQAVVLDEVQGLSAKMTTGVISQWIGRVVRALWRRRAVLFKVLKHAQSTRETGDLVNLRTAEWMAGSEFVLSPRRIDRSRVDDDNLLE